MCQQADALAANLPRQGSLVLGDEGERETIEQQHRILLFGQAVYGLTADRVRPRYCRVESFRFPEEWHLLRRLADYDLVLLDYSTFDDPEAKEYVASFDAMTVDALQAGTTFCFLFSSQDVPIKPSTVEFVEECESQLAYRWLVRMKVAPRPLWVLPDSTAVRNEFHLYAQRWGKGRLRFEGESGDALMQSGSFVTGFAKRHDKGYIMYVPCLRDSKRPSDHAACLRTLIESILSYLTASRTTPPAWANEPLFPEERRLVRLKVKWEGRVQKLEQRLLPFAKARELPFLVEHDFEEVLPEFIKTHMGLPVRRHETSREDFWLLDPASQKPARVVEAKSHNRGLQRADVHQVCGHRQTYDLPEDFPALLVATLHLNAASWKQKLERIPPQSFELAAQDHVLILRIEDLLQLWYRLQRGQLSRDALLSMLLTRYGWLEVPQDGDPIQHP